MLLVERNSQVIFTTAEVLKILNMNVLKCFFRTWETLGMLNWIFVFRILEISHSTLPTATDYSKNNRDSREKCV